MAPESDEKQKVQCPRCRKVVVLEIPASPAGETKKPLKSPAGEAALREKRIEILEARVEALERAVSEATRLASKSVSVEQFRWVISDPPPLFSPEQADVVHHNLRAVQAHRIMIQFPFADRPAQKRAEWFKEIFVEERWTVKGPAPVNAVSAESCISFASCLPVSRHVAATYLALCAAAIPLVLAFDPELSDDEERLVVL